MNGYNPKPKIYYNNIIMLNPWIMGVDGEFWAWKTNMMSYMLERFSRDPYTICFTNIKINYERENIIFYEDILDAWYNEKGKKNTTFWMLEILKIIWQIDNLQRKANTTRANRLRFYIFQDEWGIIFNQHARSKFPLAFFDYLLQVRKINVTIFLWVQLFTNLSKQLREHIARVFYFEPFLGYFTSFWSIRCKKLDVEGNIRMKQYLAKDEQGDYITKEKPIDQHVKYWYKPRYYKLYDDLYLNKKFTNEVIHFPSSEKIINSAMLLIAEKAKPKKSLLSKKLPVSKHIEE